MAEQTDRLTIPSWINRISSYRTFFVPVGFVSLLAVIVVPMHPMVMDLLISANLALAAIVLLTTIYVQRPLDFSVFPSLLLGTTLIRLVLNIATTRLILTADADTPTAANDVAGRVIEAFSSFVAGNSLVVGMILFIILIIVQFVVITKGATRISEVAARFMLDGMPGKQMAIDADLNAGLVNEEQARQRRAEISQEADFYGAMDGASKFVRGDAIAGIIITLVNIVGGFAVGVFEKGWSLTESLAVFTRLTIGDGLVSQLPAFVISIAAGLIVTRSSGRTDLGTDLSSQLIRYWRVLAITAVFLALMALTGLPSLPMLLLAALSGSMAWVVYDGNRRRAAQAAKLEASDDQAGPPPIEQALHVDTLELEIGYSLVRLVNANKPQQGGDLLDRISLIRRQLAGELGLVMPPVRIRDNMQLPPNDYHIKIRANSVAHGSIFPDQFLAMDSGLSSSENAELAGIKTREPAFGLEAVWIESGQKQRAESLNYTVVDAVSVLSTHLTEVVKSHAAELLTREETNSLITQLREKAPKLADEVLGVAGSTDQPVVKPADLQKVLQNLLQERVPVRDMETIVETLGDWASRTKDYEVLTEYVRNALRRTICNQYVEMQASSIDDEQMPTVAKLFCVSLDPALEDLIINYIDRGNDTTTLSMPPAIVNQITSAIVKELRQLIQGGHQPVVLASPQVRVHIHRLLEAPVPAVAVLGYNEISKGVEVESVGLAQVESEQESPQLQGVAQ
ncbi:MAG: flagellar biosynthesis protein FlhA [Phycisphaeraceae bacterium]|nr:flagellar biosynthesis protein FlhA [Phycisphaeraceae bacterium]